ncbi:MAG: ATP-binding protein [Gammaproteobacteria bacterium]|jgi:anti-sigma regulatory factor (Ser/Thr protein kinase)
MQQHVEKDILFELRLPAKADRLALVRAVVQRAVETAGCDDSLGQKLVIAVNEACMNIIQHAYHGVNDGKFELAVWKDVNMLYFRLTDQADHIDLNSVKSRDLDDIKPGGLGIHFISEIMDDFKIGHLQGDNGNYMEMIKTIE